MNLYQQTIVMLSNSLMFPQGYITTPTNNCYECCMYVCMYVCILYIIVCALVSVSVYDDNIIIISHC